MMQLCSVLMPKLQTVPELVLIKRKLLFFFLFNPIYILKTIAFKGSAVHNHT